MVDGLARSPTAPGKRKASRSLCVSRTVQCEPILHATMAMIAINGLIEALDADGSHWGRSLCTTGQLQGYFRLSLFIRSAELRFLNFGRSGANRAVSYHAFSRKPCRMHIGVDEFGHATFPLAFHTAAGQCEPSLPPLSPSVDDTLIYIL